MIFVNSKVEIEKQEPGLAGIKKIIEKAGRTSYKSEDKITEDSAEAFLDMLEKRGHLAAFEHGTVYLLIDQDLDSMDTINFYSTNPYSVVRFTDDGRYAAVTTNYRVIVENNRQADLAHLCDPTNFHEKRVSFRIICDRGVTHELVRHRVFSFLQESSRYCNYSKDKFGNQLTFIRPEWMTTVKTNEVIDETMLDPAKIAAMIIKGTHPAETLIAMSGLLAAEKVYLEMTGNLKCTPQVARMVLPNAIKTEIMMTGIVSQWEGFLALRSSDYGAKGQHPDMDVIANEIFYLLKTEGYVESNEA